MVGKRTTGLLICHGGRQQLWSMTCINARFDAVGLSMSLGVVEFSLTTKKQEENPPLRP